MWYDSQRIVCQRSGTVRSRPGAAGGAPGRGTLCARAPGKGTYPGKERVSAAMGKKALGYLAVILAITAAVLVFVARRGA